MPLFQLSAELTFPNPQLAEPDGLLAIGGDLSSMRLLLAYNQGIFPWYNPGEPILWWSPDPRMILVPKELHIPRSLRPLLNANHFNLTLDRDFAAVIRNCRSAPRPGQSGTWITPEMQTAYVALNGKGYAHSLEIWEDEELVGGLYGIAVGAVFCGESMFASTDNASKYGFVKLVQWLGTRGYHFIDCQLYTAHLARFGAGEISRESFLERLERAVKEPTDSGSWSRFEADLNRPTAS